MTEVQSYRVLASHDGFETRVYPDHFLVSVDAEGDIAGSGSRAFGQLAGFIAGANHDRESIAMTAPVTQAKTPDGYRVSFVMPAKMEFPPVPLSPDLTVEAVSGVSRVAMQFSGTASEKRFLKMAEKLKTKCAAIGIRVNSEPIFARYNGPWTPGPLRRNEVMFDLLHN